MQLTILLPAVLALLPAFATALGTVQVKNNCSYKVYLDSVQPNAATNSAVLAAKTGSYTETYRGAGVALKMSNLPNQDYSNNVLQVQYSVGGNLVYYAISTANGNPFFATVVPSTKTCTTVSNTSNMGQTEACTSNGNLVVTACP
ncbi:hypothetical protein MMC25_006877 [Agyrium rufum]|nr:hypothetical protein [Agyrium rufum]